MLLRDRSSFSLLKIESISVSFVLRYESWSEVRIISVIIASVLLSTIVGMTPPIQVDAFTESEIVVASGNITDYLWSSDGTQVAYVVCPEGQFFNIRS